MKKPSRYYFSHDLHSRSDKEMLKLRMRFGMEGVGIYWCMVEMLHEEGGYLLRSEYERIAFELQTNSDTISAIVETLRLFKFDDEKLWSESALRRIDERNRKSEAARESISKRWRNTNVQQTNNDGNTIKGNKKKINKGGVGEYSGLPDGKAAIRIENNKAYFDDGTYQELGHDQLEMLASGDLKPKHVKRGSKY
jgi:hypothetical protein